MLVLTTTPVPVSVAKKLKCNPLIYEYRNLSTGEYFAIFICCALFVTVYIEEFATYLKYVRQLDFYETPKYDYLRQLFANVMTRNDWSFDWLFDWTSHSQV